MLQANERHLLDANVTTNSTQVTPTSVPVTQQPYKPAYMDAAFSVADLLLRSANPGSQWVSSGDAGVFVSVATYAGRGYPSMQPALVAGPVLDANASRADASVKSNVAIALSGGLTGTCTDDNGVTVAGDRCLVSTTAVYAPDPAATLASGYLANANLPSGFQVMSGAVTLAVGGESTDTLPCAGSGCTASLQVPVAESADARWLYQCYLVVEGEINARSTAVSSAPGIAINNTMEVPTFSCSVRQAGMYVVGRYNNPDWQFGAPETSCTSCANMVSATTVASTTSIKLVHARPQLFFGGCPAGYCSACHVTLSVPICSFIAVYRLRVSPCT